MCESQCKGSVILVIAGVECFFGATRPCPAGHAELLRTMVNTVPSDSPFVFCSFHASGLASVA